MYLEKIYTLKLDTSIGIRYLVAGQFHERFNGCLKNGKNVAVYHLKARGIMNPWGLGTLDEIKNFYDKERYISGEVPKPDNFDGFKSMTNQLKVTSSPISFYEICDMVTKSLENPNTPESIYSPMPPVFLWVAGKEDEKRLPNIKLENAIEKLLEYQKEGFKLHYISFGTNIVTKQQRKEMEKGFYLIKLFTKNNFGTNNYVERMINGVLLTTSYIPWSRQFKTENEAFNYISKYEPHFSKTGYEILEIKGMTLEDGLETDKITTL